MTSREDVNRLTEASRRLVEMARRDLRGLMATMNLSNPEAVKATLMEIVPVLVREYGDLSAIAAAEWYEEVRAASNAAGTHASVLSDGIEDGRVRASVGQAAVPEEANRLYEYFVAQARPKVKNLATGKFQEMMEIELINNGPVTILMDSRKTF